MVSIIILSYNTEALTLRCLTSIVKHLKGTSYEIIVVDNASSDGSVAAISTQFPHVTLVKSKKNLGFAAGCNLGVKNARGDHFLFLNSDVELFENTPQKMLRVFPDYAGAGIVGGMLQNKDGSLQRSYASFYTLPHVFRLLFGGDKAEIKRFTDNGVKKVDWVSGGCMLITRELFEKLQGFDEQYFMYVEDMELCFRAYELGSSVYIDPSSIVTHVGQGSSDKTFAIVNIYRGLQLFYKQHRNQLQYSILILFLRVKAILCIVIGSLLGKPELVKRYKKALQVL